MTHSPRSRALAALGLASSLGLLMGMPAAADWPTYHHDAGRTGFDGQQVAFNSATPDWTSPALDGATYAQPLVVGNHVFVATENNSVYAFDVTTGNQVWRFNAGAPVPNANLAAGCGNVDPVGITGTPVIDPVAGRLYAVAQVNPSSPAYQLVTVDINTGLAVGSPVTLTYNGFNPITQIQRGALALANNTVYVPFGGRIGDCPPYDGVVIGVAVSGGGQVHYTTPTNGGRAGIWATGGVAADQSGNLFVATGNSGCPGAYDYDDSVIKLSANLTKLDQFAPTDWQTLSCADADLGSSAPTLIGNGLLFIQGKEPTAYLLNQSALGSTFTGNTFNAGGEAFSGPGCASDVFGAAAYMAPYVFVPCSSGGLLALKVDLAAKTFSRAWQATNGRSTPPIVAGGAVWTISGGSLEAFDPATGKQLFSHSTGPFSTSFPSPSAGAGRTFVADDNNLESYLLNQDCIAPSTPTSTGASGGTTFNFAEGYTGPGFTECLTMLMPNVSGTATIDYWTQSGHTMGTVALTAGRVATINVNQVVGANQQVSVRVTLPGPGIVERLLHFDNGSWHGSTDKVGVPAASSEWDFAEGSTLPFFSEYVTLQNPNAGPVTATLTYMTDSGAHPVKTLTLNATSRTTIEVFNGDTTSNVIACVPNGAGASCGVGRGIGGVSLKVATPGGQPIVAERPFYVNGFNFGSGPVNDGHAAFGANAPALQWNFAEGTTLAGFNEYLTLQNPNSATTAVNLQYVTDAGAVTTKSLTVPGSTRTTVEVFRGDQTARAGCTAGGGGNCGVGPNIGGVSVQITAAAPIVAERPMYIVHDFGSGSVAGATDVLGATGLGTLFGFSALSTSPGENDYLTLQNPGAAPAPVSIDYYTTAGKVTRIVTVSAHARLTVQVFDTVNGIGPGQVILGVVVRSTSAVPLLVEKPTYGSTPNAYGATDTMGYSPASF